MTEKNPYELVRVKLPNGTETTVSRGLAESMELTEITTKDTTAVRPSGVAVPAKIAVDKGGDPKPVLTPASKTAPAAETKEN